MTIDKATAILEKMRDIHRDNPHLAMSDYGNEELIEALNLAIRFVTADAVVPVICEECAEYQDWVNGKICMRLGSYYGNVMPRDFCSYGRNREDG